MTKNKIVTKNYISNEFFFITIRLIFSEEKKKKENIVINKLPLTKIASLRLTTNPSFQLFCGY